MEDCIFCKIIKGEIPCKKVYEDEVVICFEDINPEAPVHLLIVPKVHIDSLNDLVEAQKDIIGHIYLVAAKVAKQLNIHEKGYRVVSNCGKDAGQTVQHIHFHLLGGKTLQCKLG